MVDVAANNVASSSQFGFAWDIADVLDSVCALFARVFANPAKSLVQFTLKAVKA